MQSIARFRLKDYEIQSLEDHLKGVKELAEKYGTKLGIKHICGLAGLLHDVGKYSSEFRNYILEIMKNPDKPPKRGSVDHSTAGGKLLHEISKHKNDPHFKLLSDIVGNVIISHHSYLHDYLNENLESDYLKRVEEKMVVEFEEVKKLFFKNVMNEIEFNEYLINAKNELINYMKNESDKNYPRRIMFLTKYIYSVLIDADRTNSMLFEEDNILERKNTNKLFSEYYDRLKRRLDHFSKDIRAQSPINQLRMKMSNECEEFANRPSGIYTLSIPTGGGKTLASLRYALKHAMKFNKERIIYVVPFTTIIEQNVIEVRKVLQDYDNILEHHSNVIDDNNVNETSNELYSIDYQKLMLAKDNWDSPIIFTTMVQFLDVFYAYGTRNIRRLHNLINSVIIFDEVQKLPIKCVSLFNHSLNFLKNYGNASIILCTATQPALNYVNHKLELNPNAEIIDNVEKVVDKFKRVNIVDLATDSIMSREELVKFIENKLTDVNDMLIILNTKTAVRNLYKALKKLNLQIPIYHLSTSMCASHRTIVLNKIRNLLANNEKVICVSTQLIEAGVDISFDCVVRSLAGLDSIAQAAGRCNRHAEKSIRDVYVIDYKDENLSRLREIKVGKYISKNILKDIAEDKSAHGGSILSLQAMERYFKEYYKEFEADLNYPIKGLNETMIQLLMAEITENNYLLGYKAKYNHFPNLSIANSYKTAAENFTVIEDSTINVIVPFGEGKEVIAQLNSTNEIEDISNLLKKAQQFTVNLYEQEFKSLEINESITTIFNNRLYALKDGAYDQEYGVNIGGDSIMEQYIF